MRAYVTAIAAATTAGGSHTTRIRPIGPRTTAVNSSLNRRITRNGLIRSPRLYESRVKGRADTHASGEGSTTGNGTAAHRALAGRDARTCGVRRRARRRARGPARRRPAPRDGPARAGLPAGHRAAHPALTRERRPV